MVLPQRKILWTNPFAWRHGPAGDSPRHLVTWTPPINATMSVVFRNEQCWGCQCNQKNYNSTHTIWFKCSFISAANFTECQSVSVIYWKISWHSYPVVQQKNKQAVLVHSRNAPHTTRGLRSRNTGPTRRGLRMHPQLEPRDAFSTFKATGTSSLTILYSNCLNIC